MKLYEEAAGSFGHRKKHRAQPCQARHICELANALESTEGPAVPFGCISCCCVDDSGLRCWIGVPSLLKLLPLL